MTREALKKARRVARKQFQQRPAKLLHEMADGRETSDREDLASQCERFLAWLLVRNFSPETVRDRRSALTAFIVWCAARGVTHPAEVTRPVIERFQRHLYLHRKPCGAPLSFRTQAQRLIPVKGFFKWLTRQDVILSNPAADIELPRPEQRLPGAVMTVEEAERVLAVPDLTEPFGLRDRAIMEVFYATAIRRMELVRLTLWDIDHARCALIIRQGKGKKDRIVPLGERAAFWIRAYESQIRPGLVAGRDNGILFLSRDGNSLEPKRLSETVAGYLERAGIGKGRTGKGPSGSGSAGSGSSGSPPAVRTGACHLFRHTAATLMLEGGADIRFIQSLLGHASLDSTMIYTRVSVQKLAEIHAATHPGARLQRPPQEGPSTQERGAQGHDTPATTASRITAILDHDDGDQDEADYNG